MTEASATNIYTLYAMCIYLFSMMYSMVKPTAEIGMTEKFLYVLLLVVEGHQQMPDTII